MYTYVHVCAYIFVDIILILRILLVFYTTLNVTRGTPSRISLGVPTDCRPMRSYGDWR